MSGSFIQQIAMAKVAFSEVTKMFSRPKTALQALPEGCDLSGKTAIVTGGNSGIGVETCRALTSAGCNVFLCARNVSEGQQIADEIAATGTAKGSITVKQLDLADLKKIKTFTDDLIEHLGDTPINYLILNAGVMACELMRTSQGFEMQIGVNHIGHFYLTKLLLPKLKTQTGPCCVVAVSSEGHRIPGLDISDMNYDSRKYSRWGAYGQSKLANILFAKELAKRLVFELFFENLPSDFLNLQT